MPARRSWTIYATDFAARTKDDASPVTEADERAEAIILAALAETRARRSRRRGGRGGGGPLSGDRRDASSWSIRSTAPRSSCRGTASSRSTSRWWRKGVPVAGVVYAPALGRLFAGDRPGARAGRVEAGRLGALAPIAVRPPPPRRAHRRRQPLARIAGDRRLRAALRGRRLPRRRLVAEVLPRSPAARPISIRASAAPWNGTRPPATRCCARPAASTSCAGRIAVPLRQTRPGARRRLRQPVLRGRLDGRSHSLKRGNASRH